MPGMATPGSRRLGRRRCGQACFLAAAPGLSSLGAVISAARKGTQALNHQSHSAVTLSRLLAVDWDPDFMTSLGYARSRARLMGEYLRRAAGWVQELDGTSNWPFFDIAGRWAPDVQAPAELAEQLDTLISHSTGWQGGTCRAALRWAAMLDAAIPQPPHLEDPFEPLLLMFERGGGYTSCGGFIDLGGSSVLPKTWRDHLSTTPIVSLDQNTLDALDQPNRTIRPE